MALDNLDFDLDDLSADQSDDSPGIKSLRAAVKAANATIKQLTAEVGTFRTKERTGTLSELLSSKGLTPVQQKLYPKDAEATEEAVQAWLTEFGEAFGVTETATTAVPAAQQQAMQQMQDASAQAPAPSPGDMNTLMARLQAATSPAESQAVYTEFGMRPV